MKCKSCEVDEKMKDAVVLKSFPNGITLLINEDVPFDELVEEVRYKFTEARNFFGKSNMALSIEGKKLSDMEELRLLDAIRTSCDVNIICIVEHDEEKDKHFLKALQQVESKLQSGDEGQFYKGTLKNREVLETENSIVILGDVYPGSAVISSRNIIVLGGLYGEAYAGGSGREDAFIVALEMEPERIKIGDFKYKHTDKQSKWGIRPKIQPKIAFLKNQRIVFEPLTKELLDNLS